MFLFPMPPLKFRTAGFPQYGFKPGPISDSLSCTRLGLNAIPISLHPPLGLLQPSPGYSRSVAIRSYCVSAALTVSSDHPDPEALRIEKSYVVSSHPRSYGLIRLSDKLLPTSLARLYGRSLAFKDSSCLSIRLSPLYLHISHRLPPSIRREVYQVLSPIPSLIPLAITDP